MVEQVGGDHYAAAYQHWDWVPETGLPYLEGCATKYLDRWRKKDGEGVEGLKKAVSYLEKVKAHGMTVCPPAVERKQRSAWKREKYLEARSLPEADANTIRLIDEWYDHDDLDMAIRMIKELINEAG